MPNIDASDDESVLIEDEFKEFVRVLPAIEIFNDKTGETTPKQIKEDDGFEVFSRQNCSNVKTKLHKIDEKAFAELQ